MHIGNQQIKQIGCGLGAKFGPNYVQYCEKSKETGNIISYFSYFTWDYLLKQEAVVVKPPDWKFIAIIAKIPSFKDVQATFLPDLGQKWQNLIMFNNFTLVSLRRVTKLMII